MNDRPQAEACPVAEPVLSEPVDPAAESAGDALYERVAAILPRLITISTSVALIGPALLPISHLDSFGSGVRGC